MPISKIRKSILASLAVISGSNPNRFLDGDSLYDIPSKHLVACFHIGRQRLVSVLEKKVRTRFPIMCQKEDLGRFRTHKTRSICHVRLAVHDRPNKLMIFFRVVFEVRILDNHDVIARLLKSGAERSALRGFEQFRATVLDVS